MKIEKIEGVGQAYALILDKHGVRTTRALLEVAAHRQGRKDLAKQTGISEKKILDWVNRADLMRVKGVGEEYGDLLEAAGVDTVRELGTRRPDSLHQTLLLVNRKKRLVRRPPSLSQVARWVDEAKLLLPLITH